MRITLIITFIIFLSNSIFASKCLNKLDILLKIEKNEKLAVGKKLGEGSFAKVHLLKDYPDYTIKSYLDEYVHMGKLGDLYNDLQVLNYLDSKGVPVARPVSLTEQGLIRELAPGRPLNEVISNKKISLEEKGQIAKSLADVIRLVAQNKYIPSDLHFKNFTWDKESQKLTIFDPGILLEKELAPIPAALEILRTDKQNTIISTSSALIILLNKRKREFDYEQVYDVSKFINNFANGLNDLQMMGLDAIAKPNTNEFMALLDKKFMTNLAHRKFGIDDKVLINVFFEYLEIAHEITPDIASNDYFHRSSPMIQNQVKELIKENTEIFNNTWIKLSK